MKKPTVMLTNDGFYTDARQAASTKGYPNLRIIPETVPCECSVMEDADEGIAIVMDQIVDALTKPLTTDEATPRAKDKENPTRIAFKGNLEEINRFYYKRGWSDGLPVIPPTEEKVKEMMTGTDLAPDHILGLVEPRLGKATVEKVAVNAVMAGALPTHFPVIITAVQAMLDPKSWFGTYSMSTGSWAPCWIINGPVRGDIRVNSGSGSFSPGDIANAAIGRAMGLVIKNIGGIRKGIEDMGVLGNPCKYSMVIAENEETSPWEPLHVGEGFNKQDSAITLFYPNSYSQVWPYGSDDRGILNGLIYNLQPGRGGLFCWVLTPQHAKVLAARGWTKEMITEYIADFARVPAYRHGYFYQTNTSIAKPGKVAMNPMDPMPIIQSSGHIRILVAGGPGAFMGLLSSASIGGTSWVTKKIDLPANWNKLVAKYKNVVPVYEKY